ncbi:MULTISPECIES: flagellar motor switch protein FliN [Providencia]|uniref:Flagellar motor switch protein FliN n=1 Tax=Providencia heimbachae ATCC 35613 TaxID=1354272 RepID=A0A1B7K184_9GAMM|nr:MULTISPECIES: flagellar motor switch protein FliN [Providencia]MBP6123823.1 flagellar motor switch protein FliN [Providencia sp.]MDD9338198.1 flagellar motor switch protein FliN [Providencia heimbachae]NIH23177.1 flagellar motor switch protein FliN [Providencia heimbachae]OAT53922.1 flagellar motor switch protein [Providencia heimbachae ATCC 35613]QCJ70682.1 flagellar motor switch protein FliN [Providencia heimbachae]
MSEAKNSPDASTNLNSEDLWAEALELQKKAEAASAGSQAFDNFDGQNPLNQLSDINLIMDIPVRLSVELGRTKMTIKKLLSLSQGSVVSLDGLAGEPLDILINGYLIAQGEVVVVSDNYGIRITDIITPSERMRRLSR